MLPAGTQCPTVAHYRLVTLSQTHPSYCGYCRLLPRDRGGGGSEEGVEVRGVEVREGGSEGGGGEGGGGRGGVEVRGVEVRRGGGEVPVVHKG